MEEEADERGGVFEALYKDLISTAKRQRRADRLLEVQLNLLVDALQVAEFKSSDRQSALAPPQEFEGAFGCWVFASRSP